MAPRTTHSLTLLLTLLVAAVSSVLAATSGPSQCVAFDANWNLLAFNFNGKDYNAGTQDNFSATTSATDITVANRPPFDVSSSPPLCFLSQFTNSIYIINADASDHSLIYIYDATAKSWSAQKTSAPPSSYDPSAFGAILDHDTNVFYALSGGELFSLDMALLKAATGDAIPWVDVQKPDLTATASGGDGGSGVGSSYQPVMALAQNHIHFLDVPGLDPGSAKIFVIHFSFLQPDPQSYGNFPNTHGRTASFFKDTGVQTNFAFVPDDGSATYVIDVLKNSTVSLTGPKTKDPFAMYTASPTALVQLASTGGAVQWLGYDPSAGTGTSWQTLSSLPSISLASSSGGNSTAPSSSSKGNSTGTASASGSKSTSTGSSSSTSGAVVVQLRESIVCGAVLGVIAISLAFGI